MTIIKQFIYPFVDRGGALRPLVPIRITNPFDGISVFEYAILDTGADNCVFPKHIAINTHHNLMGNGFISEVTFGIGEEIVNIWKHTFVIELLSPNDFDIVIWKSENTEIGCLEHDGIPAVLGFSNFLCFFSINFNYQREEISIEILS